MSWVHWRNHLKFTSPLSTYSNSKYTYANPVRPHTSMGQRPRVNICVKVRTPQFCNYWI